MAKSKKAAAAAITITADCERDEAGYGALAFVKHDAPTMTATRADISAAKATLLAAGFESDEVATDAETNVVGWDPRNSDELLDGSWALAAVLNDEDGDVIALLARPANATSAWPFPRGKDGESGPAVSSEPVTGDVVLSDGTEATIVRNPETMTKTEAHLGRGAGRFELPDPTTVKLKSWTPRTEKHGDDDVSATSVRLVLTGPNTLLDTLSPTLRKTLYAAADTGAHVAGQPASQQTINGVEESTPLLRCKDIETIDLKSCFEGWTLRIYHGIDEEDPFVIGGCKVDGFALTGIFDGGSIALEFRVGSSDIDEHEAGWLYGKQKQEIEISLHAPAVKPDAIDGSQAAFDADHPPTEQDAGDLFAAEHGGTNEDGPGAAPGDGYSERSDEPEEV